MVLLALADLFGGGRWYLRVVCISVVAWLGRLVYLMVWLAFAEWLGLVCLLSAGVWWGLNCGGGLSYGFGFALCGLVVVLFAFACSIRAC